MEWENLTRVLNDYGENLVENYQSALADRGINASGDLSKSLKYKIDTGTSGVVEVKLELAHYWKYIENGRRAGKFPPLTAIKEWIRVKPIIPRPMANGKLPTENQLAFLIGRSIKENGILPRPILQERIDWSLTAFMNEIEQAIADDLSNEVEIMFNEMGW